MLRRDAATGVARTVHPSFTFNIALDGTTVNGNNFFLIKDSDNSVVPGTVAISDALGKVVTFTPTAQLAATTAYHWVYTASVKGGNNVPVAGLVEVNFTTAA